MSEQTTISIKTKFFTWLRGTCYVITALNAALAIHIAFYGLPKFVKTVELWELAEGIATAQDKADSVAMRLDKIKK